MNQKVAEDGFLFYYRNYLTRDGDPGHTLAPEHAGLYNCNITIKLSLSFFLSLPVFTDLLSSGFFRFPINYKTSC